MQDTSFDQRKLKVNDTYKEDEKVTTNIEPLNDEDVVNQAYLATNLSKIESHLPYIEKGYNEFVLLSNKQFQEQVLTEGAVKTTIQKLYD